MTMSGVNYFFGLTTIISPYRVASPINVTELVDVVLLDFMEDRTSLPPFLVAIALDGFLESIEHLVVGPLQDRLSQRCNAC